MPESIPIGFCQCGCGEKTNIVKTTNKTQERVCGQPTRFVIGHRRRERQIFAPKLCDCGCGKETTRYESSNKNRGWKKGQPRKYITNHHRRDSNFKQIQSGERFGRLLAKLNLSQMGSNSLWLCVCDCGNEARVKEKNLYRGYTKSCGCYVGDKIRRWPKKLAAARGVYNSYRCAAKRRNLKFEISFDEAMTLFKSNCKYCGIIPRQIKIGLGQNDEFVYNGIDRVDNDAGYFKENCVPCCKTCNYAKCDMSSESFESYLDNVFNARYPKRGIKMVECQVRYA
jgi:hypothetical protein